MTDMTEGWPPDPENEDLARFGHELQQSLPQLPDESLKRVEGRLSAEPRPRRRWRLLAIAAVAAGLLLAMVGTLHRWTQPAPNDLSPAPTGVQESFTVELAVPPGGDVPGRPLLRLDENRSLFTD